MSMLEDLMKAYVMAMAYDVRSPTPHLVGPPGTGKSTVMEQLAELVGKKLHVINVSRLSPLELEGVQMPINDNTALHMIPAVFWSRLQEGDIILFDEFLRGFPEVYNGLLDIFTSRRAGDHVLPKVFIAAASNSVIAYDKALEDRLLHLPVEDPRNNQRVQAKLCKLMVDALDLYPDMVTSPEMINLMASEVHPMFEMLDNFKTRQATPTSIKGHSIRNLIGQVQLRLIQVAALRELIDENNRRAMSAGKCQYVLLPNGRNVDARYEAAARNVIDNPRLTPGQRRNMQLNLQLIEMEMVRNEKEEPNDLVDDLDGLDLT